MSRNYAGLSRERIIVEALHIIAGRGLGGLSMRRLGDALDVEAMAIYHHFPRGKEQLFNAIAAYVTTARVVSGLTEGQGPPEEVTAEAAAGAEEEGSQESPAAAAEASMGRVAPSGNTSGIAFAALRYDEAYEGDEYPIDGLHRAAEGRARAAHRP